MEFSFTYLLGRVYQKVEFRAYKKAYNRPRAIRIDMIHKYFCVTFTASFYCFDPHFALF
jgi:hypothetical protein